jgi:adenine deaminase
MMNYPGVLNGDEEVMRKINFAHEQGKPVDGHAPGLSGDDAIKYINAGISTDHECITYEEALHKLKNGMKILIREGSSAKNFEALYPLIDEYPDSVMLCTDDSHPDDLIKGHINLLVKRALKKGCNLYNVLKVAAVNAVNHYRLENGLLRVNDFADFVLIDNPESFTVLATYIKGKCVYRDNQSFIQTHKPIPINQFNILHIDKNKLQIKKTATHLRVINAIDGQLITKETIEMCATDSQNNLISNIETDVLKMVVVNRYHEATPAVAFIKNTGLKRGAFASTVAHDSHNIVAVGTNDDDLTKAIQTVINCKGGLCVACGDEVQALPLPVAGLMSTDDAHTVAQAYEQLDKKVKAYGSTLHAPFMTLSFMALLVIPQLKLSDKGLFDGAQFRFVDLQIN